MLPAGCCRLPTASAQNHPNFDTPGPVCLGDASAPICQLLLHAGFYTQMGNIIIYGEWGGFLWVLSSLQNDLILKL